MTNLGNDLFASYRRYKGMDVDSPQYEPLENEVVSKDDLKRLRAREYAEKNKDKIKIKRLEKLIAELRAENKTLKEEQTPDDREELLRRVDELEETNQILLRERNCKSDNYREENNALIRDIEKLTQDFEEFKQAVRVIMKFI